MFCKNFFTFKTLKYFLIGIDQFLQQVGPPLFEVVIFTAETGMTVFPIIEALDPNNIISYKLVRDATHFVDGHHIKNLDKLNRNLSKVNITILVVFHQLLSLQ